MRQLIGKHWRFFFFGTLAAIAFRLFFVLKIPVVAGDSLVYADIARNLLNHGIYGTAAAEGVHTTLIRLPGYPLFLAAVFRIFGQDNFLAVMLVQAVFDIATCYLLADIALRIFSGGDATASARGERVAMAAFLIAALCPFTANYVGTPLTECLEIFFIALAIDIAIVAFDRRSYGYWAACGAAVAAAIQLRPDGGLLLGSIGLAILWQLWRNRTHWRRYIASGLLMTAVALSPCVPWAIRNWRQFHVFQPLVTTGATDPGEYVPQGWDHWVKTWILDYSSTEDVTFPVSGEPISIDNIPARAFDSPQDRQRVATLIDGYNKHLLMTPELSDQFGQLADASIRRHPIRYYILLPMGRMLDIWLRPRTEMLPLDTHWWRFQTDPRDSFFALSLLLLNLMLVAAAIAGTFRLKKARYVSLLLIYPVVRTVFLGVLGGVEDRYTLECFPFVILLAAVFVVSLLQREAPAAA